MIIRFAISIVFAAFAATMLCATAARAEGRGDLKADLKGDDCPDQMTFADDGVPLLTEVVVPCAMVDSGLLGADCHDAAFYVVNQTGTLLCRLDVMMLGVSTTTSTIDDSQPAAVSFHAGAFAHAVAADVVEFRLAPAGSIDLPRAVGPSLLGPADDHVSFSPRPS